MTSQLVRFSIGRILLHFVCFIRHGRFRWHLAGVLREFHRHPASIAGFVQCALLLLAGAGNG